MADLIATAKEFLPNISGAGIFNFFTWLLIFIVVLALCGVAVYFVIRGLKFKYKIVKWEKINGQFQPSGKDRAMEVPVGKSGDRALYLAKNRKIIPTPSLQTGRRTYYFFIREDGEWINFTPGDFDAEARAMGSKFLDKEMRYARIGLQGTMKDRYEKPGFWEKHGQMIINISVFAIVGVILWLIAREVVNMISNLNPVLDKTSELVEQLKQLTGAIDVVKSGGSGFVPA